MKILLTSAYLPKLHYDAGEQEEKVWSLGELYKSLGHDVFYFCKTPDEAINTPENVMTTNTLKEGPLGKIPWMFNEVESFGVLSDMVSGRQFTKALEQFRPDIVHFFDILPLSLKLFDITFFKLIPSILTMYDYKFLCMKRTLFRDADKPVCTDYGKGDCLSCMGMGSFRMTRQYLLNMRRTYFEKQLEKVDIFTCPSKTGRDLLSLGGLPEERIQVVPDLINFPVLERPDQSDPGLIVFLGDMVPEEGFDLALKTFELIHKVIEHTRLVVIGKCSKPDELDKIKNQLKAKKLFDSVEFFTEDLPRNRVNFLRVADAVMVADQWPSMVNKKVLEAMANARAIVSGDLGNASELIQHGVSGLLVKHNDAKAFANAIISIVKNPIDAHRLGLAAQQQYMLQSGEERTVQEYLNIYQQLIDTYQEKLKKKK